MVLEKTLESPLDCKEIQPVHLKGNQSLIFIGKTESDMTSNLACMHALEKEMATHCSILACRIPGTEESGGLLSVGSHRVGHD